MSHASIPAEVRAARGLPDDLVRIACGIEDCDDLISDLSQALDKAARFVKPSATAEGAVGGRSVTGGAAAAAAGAAEREAQLLARIAALEARLDAQEVGR